MAPRFRREAKRIVTAAVCEAEERGDPMVGTEHLLLGITAGLDAAARSFLAGTGVTEDDVRAALIDRDIAALAAVGVAVDPALVAQPARSGRRRHRSFTAGAKQVMEAAPDEARLLRHRHVGWEHLLLAMTTAGHGDPAVDALRHLGIDAETMRRHLLAHLRAA